MNKTTKKNALKLLTLGRLQEAYPVFCDLIKKFPEDWEIYSGLEFIEIELYKNYEAASELIEKALSYGYPKDRYYRVRGYIFLQKGQIQQAILEYEKAVKEVRSIDNLRDLAECLMENNYERASFIFQEILEKDPKNEHAYYNLSWIANKQSNWKLALKMAKKANEIKPDNPHVLYQLGLAYNKLGQNDQAYEAFNSALDKGMKNGKLYIILANYEITLKGNVEKASDLIEKARAYGCLEDEYHVVYGNIYWEKGKFQQASCEYEKAVNITRSVDNLNALAQSLAKIEDERALSIWQEVLEKDSVNSRAYYGLTCLAMERPDWHIALEMATKLNELHPNEPEILHKISIIYQKLDEPEHAKKYDLEAKKYGYIPEPE